MHYKAIRTAAGFMSKERGSFIHRLSRLLEERRRMREQRNLLEFVRRANMTRRRTDEVCHSDECVAGIRNMDGQNEGVG